MQNLLAAVERIDPLTVSGRVAAVERIDPLTVSGRVAAVNGLLIEARAPSPLSHSPPLTFGPRANGRSVAEHG